MTTISGRKRWTPASRTASAKPAVSKFPPVGRNSPVNGSMSSETALSTICSRFVSSRMIDFSVSVGKEVMASTLLFTSSTTRRASAPRSSSTITVPIPSFAVDLLGGGAEMQDLNADPRETWGGGEVS